MPHDVASRAEAFLFSEGGSLTLRKLAHLSGCKEPELRNALNELTKRLEGTGLTLIETETEVTLAVAKDVAPAVSAAFERELGQEIGDAGLEVLAIVLYRGTSTRAGIDYIRGVNSSSTVRNLLARGLLERAGNPEDGREYLYRPTAELLAHIGVRSVSELPDHSEVKKQLEEFETARPDALTNDYGTGP